MRVPEGSLGPCKYCGMPADTVDHVVPQSLAEKARLSGNPDWASDIVRARIQTVSCCHDCNNALGDRVFPTVQDRKLAIKRRLRRKFKRLLDSPNWTEEELAELDEHLRGFVLRRQRLKIEIRERLRW